MQKKQNCVTWITITLQSKQKQKTFIQIIMKLKLEKQLSKEKNEFIKSYWINER